MSAADLNRFLEEEIAKLDFKNHSLFLCRDDGIVIFKRLNLNFDQTTTGALLSGIGNAAKALVEFLPGKEENEVFRLSFDTSSRGIHLLPSRYNNRPCFWTMIFHNEENPAPFKLKLRELARRLENFSEKSENTTNQNAGALFKEISDEELDLAFKKMRNSCPS